MLVTGGGEEAEQIRAFPCTCRAVAAPCLSSPSLAASDVPAPSQHCAGAVRHFLSMGAVGGNDHHGELDIEMPTLQGTAPVVTSGPAVAFLMGRWSREVHLGGVYSRSGLCRKAGFVGHQSKACVPATGSLTADF